MNVYVLARVGTSVSEWTSSLPLAHARIYTNKLPCRCTGIRASTMLRAHPGRSHSAANAGIAPQARVVVDAKSGGGCPHHFGRAGGLRTLVIFAGRGFA